jgi:transcriptional regulator with XRE-family HTH domain
MSEVIRLRRGELGLSQAQLATAAGVATRQIRRYEAGEQQPVLSVALAIAAALDITVGELAGEPSQRVNLTGDWWAAWQTTKDGVEVISAHQIHCQQRGDMVQIEAVTRGPAVVGGGYLWRGELRIWDNEILMGWYVASEGAIRSKGTMYFVVHPHGQTMTGRWVGLSHDGPMMTGWGAIAKSEDEVRELIGALKREGRRP